MTLTVQTRVIGTKRGATQLVVVPAKMTQDSQYFFHGGEEVILSVKDRNTLVVKKMVESKDSDKETMRMKM